MARGGGVPLSRRPCWIAGFSSVFAVLGVEVRWCVVAPIYVNRDPVERADPGHPGDCRHRPAAPAQRRLVLSCARGRAPASAFEAARLLEQKRGASRPPREPRASSPVKAAPAMGGRPVDQATSASLGYWGGGSPTVASTSG
jgi:hypothetical protein